MAAHYGWLGIIDKLLARGADINVKDNPVSAGLLPHCRGGTRVRATHSLTPAIT